VFIFHRVNILIAACALLGAAESAHANAERFCVVRVKNGAPTAKDVNQAHRLMRDVQILPGISRPIIFPTNRGGVWTIDEDGAFVPLVALFPQDRPFNKIAFEEHSGRIIGFNTQTPRSIYAYDKQAEAFQELRIDSEAFGGFSSLLYVPRLQSIVLGTRKGLAVLRGDKVEFLFDLNKNAEWITSLFDLPQYKAFIVGINGNLETIAIIEEDGTVRRIGTQKRWNFINEVEDRGEGTVWITSRRDRFVVELQKDEKGIFRFHSSRLEAADENPRNSEFIKRFGYPIRNGEEKIWTISRGVISSKDGRALRLNTGKLDIELSASKSDDFGQVWQIKDHEIIGRTIVYTSSGLFELLPDNNLVRISEKLNESLSSFFEWPRFKAVFVFAEKNGVYMIRSSGEANILEGGRLDPLYFKIAFVMPTRDELVFIARDGIRLIVERDKNSARCSAQ
jgi:hypothetical protein